MEKALLNHLALPAHLPSSEDNNLDQIEADLLSSAVFAARKIRDAATDIPRPKSGAFGVWDSARLFLESSAAFTHRGKINAARLVDELTCLPASSGVLVYVRNQNAAVWFHRLSQAHPDEVIVEVFEASPKNESVLATDNALVWDFPGSAVAIPLKTFSDPDFQTGVAKFLENASLETTSSALAFKAGVDIREYRETPSPTLITSMFMAIMAENGRRVSMPALQKRVRDDVNWDRGRPWRRSPFWLVLRVALARYLMLTLGAPLGRFQYKLFLSVFLADFMQSAQHSLELEQLDFLKKKLCRRLAKLEMDKDALRVSGTAEFDDVYPRLALQIEATIQGVVQRIHNEWENCKAGLIKSIPMLPRRALDSETKLELPESLQFLREARMNLLNLTTGRRDRWTPPPNFRLTSVTDRQLAEFIRPVLQITQWEEEIKELPADPHRSQLSHHVTQLVRQGMPACKGNPEQMSLLILNTMELWMKLDSQMCEAYPLLRHFHPVFTPRIMNTLFLPLFEDMARSQSIQNYLHHRINACSASGTFNIFDDPSPDCFARRFYDEDPRASKMHEVHQSIEADAQKKRESKRREWEEKSARYEDLARQVDRGTCLYTTDENDRYGRRLLHNPRTCPRCHAIEARDALDIRVCEDPLPFEDFAAKSAVFELLCPTSFAEYRDITWMIITELASPTPESITKGKPSTDTKKKHQTIPIHEDGQLSRFAIKGKRGTLALASHTKTFLRTHFRALKFPVAWEGTGEGVYRPNGMRLQYFDTANQAWLRWTRMRPQFSHHLQLHLPRDSPFRSLLDQHSFSVESEGPSSYEIMATQQSCPMGLNPHESLAFKTLLSGSSRRWVSLLVELGSANLNWSSEVSLMLVNYLALQCGPESEQGDTLRSIHSIFRDTHFVNKLLVQLESRLSVLEALASWRETHLLGAMITLATRILDLSRAASLSSEIQLRALKATLTCREICVTWFRLLREETQMCQDTSSAQQLQQRALATALLCRRTYVIHLEEPMQFDLTALEIYIESTIVIQENMVSSFDCLPRSVLHDLVAGFKLGFRLLDLVSQSIMKHQEAFGSALKRFWPEAERLNSNESTLTLQKDNWIHCDIAETEYNGHQVVHFNTLYGYLLVNGKPVGKLPQDTKNSTMIKELFGDQPLRVFQSSIAGMAYTLTIRPKGFEIHVGYVDGQQIILAIQKQPHMRVCLLNRACFVGGSGTSDLPGPLLDGMLHWLNLSNGDIYITRVTSPWNIGRGSQPWVLNLNTLTCRRQLYDGSIELVVDVNGRLFKRISRILDGLVTSNQLLVVQPSRKNLAVQIQQMQLFFFVNRNKLLFSPQLGLEIDPNQDVGTWYGLMQKLVCRRVENPLDRTVLVPLGELKVHRHRCHVKVWRAPDHRYGKFIINSTLGRIDCAAEPILIYNKALLHAYTSFILPDPLTGRTGAEESLQWLKSGICRPWIPLTPCQLPALVKIANLTPVREFHPPHLKALKTETWDAQLTTHMQHPAYRAAVEDILATSEKLAAFTIDTNIIQAPSNPPSNSAILPPGGEPSLTTRASIRRLLFERRNDNEVAIGESINRSYDSRDRFSPSDPRRRRVMEVTNLLRTRPASFTTPKNLASALSEGNTVGGYGSKYNNVSLSDRMRVDLRENWGSLVEYCRQCRSPYELMYFFAALCFRDNIDERLLLALVAFAIFEQLQTMPLPAWSEYFNFRPESAPEAEEIRELMNPFRTPASEHGEELLKWLTPKDLRKMKMKKNAHDLQSDGDCRFLVKYFLSQWPCEKPQPPPPDVLRDGFLMDIPSALEAIKDLWLQLYQNKDLAAHLSEVQRVLDQHRSDSDACHVSLGVFPSHPMIRAMSNSPSSLSTSSDSSIKFEGMPPRRPPRAEIPRIGHDLLKNDPEPNPPLSALSRSFWFPFASIPQDGRHLLNLNHAPTTSNVRPQISGQVVSRHIQELRGIVQNLGGSKSLVRKDYARDLLASIEVFANLRTPQQLGPSFLHSRDYTQTWANITQLFYLVKGILEQETPEMSAQRIRWLQLGGLWPAVTTITLLETLRSTANTTFGESIRDLVMSLGLAVTRLQRDIRLNECVLAGDMSRFQDEESNAGHTNWDPAEYPDWLLLEIESNLLIRRDQVDVALATISPQSGTNSVLQMNMGQGKTSCIIPMVAAAMADRKSLVRIITPKALLLQTAQLLQARLGNLLDRQVRHIPFSRRTDTSIDNMKLYYELHKDIQKSAGVMICLPEHNLSFMLSGQQRVLDGKTMEAKPMIKVQSWLSTVCHDILDESDYTLAARTQLIYPSGSQVSVDGHPHRWHVIEAILNLVEQHLHGLEMDFPRSIEVVRRQGGGFPLIYFLRRDVEDALLQRLAKDVSTGRLTHILPVRSFSPQQRAAIKDFISSSRRLTPAATEKMVETIRGLRPEKPEIRQCVYLLRGLLVNRILIMTLKKRWNVQYGLRPCSDPVAVPYHAKGVPSETSEWGHPDVAILFTCLVFYYDGVSANQLQQALTKILKSDDPSTEYDKWVQSSPEFPPALRAWNTIMVEDASQIREIWFAVRHNVVVIDYFLNNFVFPQHAKQFKVKLQSSGWDIPLFSATPTNGRASNGGDKAARALTTGFSGTNDNRTMLPLTIRQADLPTLSHTNAEVLTYLLHDRSRDCEIIRARDGGRGTERDLLFMLKRKGIRILIDAGAQILEMDNRSLAKTWLEVDHSCDAALYFDKGNRSWVVSKTGRETPLLASPYADDLSRCLVYLDEAHTRGTDLKFPLDSRGALTIGQGQTKDHTVQAAMRLRQLGSSQSVTFYIPPEVHQVILDLQGKTIFDTIDSSDVVSYLLDNSCDGIEQLQPLYYSQGIDFCRRTQTAIDNPAFLANEAERKRYVSAIRQNESQTLRETYEPKVGKAKGAGFKSSHPQVAAFVKELNTRRRGFQDTGRAVHASALQEVEQEREVAFEIEAVQQVKKPVKYDALGFPGIHRDLVTLARTGRLSIDSTAVTGVFRLLAATAVGRKHRVAAAHPAASLLVSTEFGRAVKLYAGLSQEQFLRPVNWLLWSTTTSAAVVLIPEEAEQIIRLLRAGLVHDGVHLITYASPITRSMLPFNDLSFFSMPQLPAGWRAPQWLKTELGLLAGRLYFEWREHATIINFLGIVEEEGDDEVDGDEEGAVVEPKVVAANSFSPRPLTFLAEWLAVRRAGQDFAHTPMGFLTQGKPLSEEHPFFGGGVREAPVVKAPMAVVKWGRGEREEEEEEEEEEDGFGEVDDMGANVGEDAGESSEDEVWMSADEELSEGE